MSRSREDPYVGILLLEVVECKDLPKMDTFGSADPYVVLRFGTHNKFVTETIYNTLNPQWKQSFKILVTKSEEKYNVEFEVFDWDKNSKNDEVGTAVVPISSFLAKTAPNDIWVDLHASKSKRSVGKLHVRGVLKDQKAVESEFWNELAKEFDSDNNQKISFVEFVTLIHTVNPKADEKSILDLAGAAGLDKAEISFDFFCNLMCGDEANLKKNPALAAILTPNSRDFIWEVCSTMNSIGEKILEGGFYGKVESSAALALVEREKIVVHDRKTGKLVDEKIPEYIWTSLNLMYQSKSGRFAVSSKRVAGILKHLSEKQGKRYNNPDSKKEIAKFIDFHNLNKDEMLESLDSFKNFNEFFFRKLKPSARPISEATNSSRAVSAADCRLHVFESVDFAKNIWIKGKNFSLVGLLQNTQIARNYEGGSLCIFRLAPQDYHRFHSPVDGELLEFVEMAGTYYTVNPVAVRTQTDVYTENKRCRLTIKSPQFGEVIFVAIGATMVGSINWTRKKGDKIKKGDELGYFAFGGSTIIVLFKKDTIKFDNDLVVNSKKPIETLVHMGESLGISCGKK